MLAVHRHPDDTPRSPTHSQKSAPQLGYNAIQYAPEDHCQGQGVRFGHVTLVLMCR